MQVKMILTCFLATIMVPGSAAAAEKTLSGKEVTALFSGNTVNYTRVKKGDAAYGYYAKDGSVRTFRGGNKRKGRWHVNDKGELCLDYGKGDRCGQIVVEDGVYRKYKDKDGERIHIITYDRFTPGKPKK